MHTILWLVFAAIIIVFLVVDLGILSRQAHKVSTKSALLQSAFWISISVAYGGLIFYLLGSAPAADFLSAYLTEKMLSVDNLFVILLLFGFFQLDSKYHHRVLYWGIMGAVFFRGAFIGLGSMIVSQFHFVLYFFGALLIYTGGKLFLNKEEDKIDFESNKVMKLAKKYLPFTTESHEGHFMKKGKFTILFMILLLVETTDILFAVDSIPAVFAITQDPFIVFTSNIFAIMGLRALFFLVENILNTFHHLQKAISFVLIFIGAKMLLDIVDIHISSPISFAVIIGAFILSLITSVLFPHKNN